MGQGSSSLKLSEQQINKSNRKCSAFIKGLEACRKANSEESAKVCKNLEVKVITCYAEDHCKPEAAEHRKCYMKLYTSGMYKGLGHCIPYEMAMKKALQSKGLSFS